VFDALRKARRPARTVARCFGHARASWTSSTHPFYETVATVIPVIIAVLYFESGFFRTDERETLEQAGLAVTAMVLLVAAEAQALSALYRQENLDGINHVVVVFALTYSLGAVAGLPFIARIRQVSRRGAESWRRAGALLFWVWAIVIVALFVVPFFFGPDPIDVIAGLALATFPGAAFLYAYVQRRHDQSDGRNHEDDEDEEEDD
jgi:hypothetical protein